MTQMTAAAYARARKVPARTVYDAIKAGAITVDTAGRLNAEQVDAGWYADHRARAAQTRSTEASRSRRRDAAALAAATAVRTLRRQLAELEATTVNRAAVEAARARRLQRLYAAVQQFPALYTATAAAALDRPPAAVRAVLERFSARLLKDLGYSDGDGEPARAMADKSAIDAGRGRA